MTQPLLVPSPRHSIPWTIQKPQHVPTNSEWVMHYSEIERMYIHERRKLRYVMQFMETKYGFRATQQMYKKRFDKWGFRKNSRRSITSSKNEKFISHIDIGSVQLCPRFSGDDRLQLVFLTNVRSWSISYFESLQYDNETSTATKRSWPRQSEEMNFALKLATDTLDRGHGSLAGRLVRKAFLLAEEILTLEGPAFVWNLLEILFYMLKLHHLRLVKVLLAHLTVLVDNRISEKHPLRIVLQVLRILLTHLPSLAPTSGESLSKHPPQDLLNEKEATSVVDSKFTSDLFLFVIEKAWALNAKILFECFDHRFFQLYFRIHWDSCSIDPPTAIFDTAKQWFARISPQQNSYNDEKDSQTEEFIQITPFKEDMLIQDLFTSPTNNSLPGNFELLRTSSLAVLRDHVSSMSATDFEVAGTSTKLLRILAGLVAAKVIEDWPVSTDINAPSTSGKLVTARAQAGNIACAVRTVMNLGGTHDKSEAVYDRVERIQSIVTLLEYAKAKSDPRLIREMWLLKDALMAVGEHDKALDIEKTALRRTEEYVQDIPIDTI